MITKHEKTLYIIPSKASLANADGTKLYFTPSLFVDDHMTLKCNVINPDGTAIDISGLSFYCGFDHTFQPSHTDLFITSNYTIVDAANGKVNFNVDLTDSSLVTYMAGEYSKKVIFEIWASDGINHFILCQNVINLKNFIVSVDEQMSSYSSSSSMSSQSSESSESSSSLSSESSSSDSSSSSTSLSSDSSSSFEEHVVYYSTGNGTSPVFPDPAPATYTYAGQYNGRAYYAYDVWMITWQGSRYIISDTQDGSSGNTFVAPIGSDIPTTYTGINFASGTVIIDNLLSSSSSESSSSSGSSASSLSSLEYSSSSSSSSSSWSDDPTPNTPFVKDFGSTTVNGNYYSQGTYNGNDYYKNASNIYLEYGTVGSYWYLTTVHNTGNTSDILYASNVASGVYYDNPWVSVNGSLPIGTVYQ